MNFTRSNRRRPEPGLTLPLVALLDVIFFMLLYFMAAGSLAPPEAELAAAVTSERRGGGRGSDISAQVLRVELAAGVPRYRLGDRVMTDKASVTAVLAKLPKQAGMIVKANDDVQWGAAAAAIQACKDAGFTKVSYVAGL